MIHTYDVTDPTNPDLVGDLKINGNYSFNPVVRVGDLVYTGADELVVVLSGLDYFANVRLATEVDGIDILVSSSATAQADEFDAGALKLSAEQRKSIRAEAAQGYAGPEIEAYLERARKTGALDNIKVAVFVLVVKHP